MKYPRSLYLEGPTGAHVIVHSEEQEKYWRETYGFVALDDPIDLEPPKKRGRPKKVEA
jgi:hypothetical protein